MRYFLAIIILLHGAIHLAGFRVNTPAVSSNFVKSPGVFWLAVAVMWSVTSGLLFSNWRYWWVFGMTSVFFSQILTFKYWKDAKYGTIVNVVILPWLFVSLAASNYEDQYKRDIKEGMASLTPAPQETLSNTDIEGLPLPVQKYIRYSGAIGKPKVTHFKVAFEGVLRESDTADWMSFHSEQTNFMNTPTRLFFLNATMKHLPVAGYHRYTNGEAFMDIRLISMIRVAYETGREMGVSETVTFFNDMCVMAPATLIDSRVKWLAVRGNHVQASFTTDDITVSAWLYFNEDGQLINFISDDRYAREEDGSMERRQWSTPLKDYQDFNGHRVAAYADAVYQYPNKEFCYGNFRTINVEYNPTKR
ncbi:MAG: hypothetical protein RIG68_23705 [Imperialibacter sp.]|uniref:DUF6544 family protein n=1 Tax=Imperialibacter sp. TaxID=2038411 RepID=UPI0032EDFDB2